MHVRIPAGDSGGLLARALTRGSRPAGGGRGGGSAHARGSPALAGQHRPELMLLAPPLWEPFKPSLAESGPRWKSRSCSGLTRDRGEGGGSFPLPFYEYLI